METGYQCQKRYNDTVKNAPSWVCEVAEKANIADLITSANKSFRPLDTMSRAEAYAVLLKSICITLDTSSTNWQTNVAKTAIRE
jgi:hypothetical protein